MWSQCCSHLQQFPLLVHINLLSVSVNKRVFKIFTTLKLCVPHPQLIINKFTNVVMIMLFTTDTQSARIYPKKEVM